MPSRTWNATGSSVGLVVQRVEMGRAKMGAFEWRSMMIEGNCTYSLAGYYPALG